jgi:hypothetical protein
MGERLHKCGTYRLASSLAAALPDGLFAHPEVVEVVAPSVRISTVLYVHIEFSRSLLDYALTFTESPQ